MRQSHSRTAQRLERLGRLLIGEKQAMLGALEKALPKLSYHQVEAVYKFVEILKIANRAARPLKRKAGKR